MTKTKRPPNALAKRLTGRGLGLSESVLKLFPKTSSMGRPEPSRWGMAEAIKVRGNDITVTVNEYRSQIEGWEEAQAKGAEEWSSPFSSRIAARGFQ